MASPTATPFSIKSCATMTLRGLELNAARPVSISGSMKLPGNMPHIAKVSGVSLPRMRALKSVLPKGGGAGRLLEGGPHFAVDKSIRVAWDAVKLEGAVGRLHRFDAGNVLIGEAGDHARQNDDEGRDEGDCFG